MTIPVKTDENPNPQPGPEAKDGVPQQSQQDGKPAADAREWVPEPLRGHKSLEKFKAPGDVVQGYINLESAYGKKFEEHLKDDAPPEVKARVRAALGVPEAAEGYDDPKPPEGHELDKGLVGGFKSTAHKLGISKSQAAGLMDWFLGQEMERSTVISQEQAKEKEEGMAALNKRWGAAAPRNIALIHQLVAEHGGAELKEALDRTGAGNDPAMNAFLARIAQTLQEDNLLTPNPVGLSVEDAKKEIAAVRSAAMKDPKHPYVDRDHPEHKAMLKRMEELNQLAYSEV